MKFNTTIFFLMFTFALIAQTPSSFEGISIEQDTFLNGRDASFYEDGDALFPSQYHFEWDYWQGGWAISSMTDSVTSGPGNLYSAKTGHGIEGSQNYAVGQQGAVIALTGEAVGQPLKGVYITNTTYAHNSMRDGDDFAKKFGGDTGDDPDFFRLTIKAYAQGQLFPDSVDFYLADFRFEDNDQDYIVKDWTWVDLSSLSENVPLGTVDSLLFTLYSTDSNDWGFNTPLFYCIDNFNGDFLTANDSPELAEQELELFPNPVVDEVVINWPGNLSEAGVITVIDASGKVVIQKETRWDQVRLDLSGLVPGVYVVRQTIGKTIWTGKVIKL
ncbi:MAG: DUF4465 domain-containing protein [Bacteroidetes bacterium]|nr:MAG: DUF4465 domain-containing protein [Bacteroidota bacterium]